MTVWESLQLSSFSSAQVIAGHAGLKNVITSTMVLEATDIENWGQPGQLLITSFFALQNLSENDLTDFFKKLSDIGISALVFKADRLLNCLPSYVIDLCNHYAIPLLQVSKEVKYETIITDILSHILDSNLTLLNHFFEIHNQMMAFALKQPSSHQILNYLKSSLHADATFYDATHNKKVSSDPAQGSFVRFELKSLKPDRYQHHQYYSAFLYYPDAFSANALAVDIPSSDGNQYYLIIHGSSQACKSVDTMIIENVVSLLQMEILKQNAIDQKLFFQNNNAIHDLLIGRYSSHNRVDSILNSLMLDRHPLYQVLLISVHLPPDAEERRNEAMVAIRKQVKLLNPNLAYCENNDQIVFLHNHTTEARTLQPKDIQASLDRLSQNSALPPFTYLAAFSQSSDRYSISRLNQEVMDICRLFDNNRQESRCVRYEDLGIYKLFLKAENLTDLESYIDPRILKLKKDAPELLDTLVALCENNLNFQKTARCLFLHPKTIQYRISRIQQIYGLDVHNAEDFLQILLAGKALLLLNEHP